MDPIVWIFKYTEFMFLLHMYTRNRGPQNIGLIRVLQFAIKALWTRNNNNNNNKGVSVLEDSMWSTQPQWVLEVPCHVRGWAANKHAFNDFHGLLSYWGRGNCAPTNWATFEPKKGRKEEEKRYSPATWLKVVQRRSLLKKVDIFYFYIYMCAYDHRLMFNHVRVNIIWTT